MGLSEALKKARDGDRMTIRFSTKKCLKAFIYGRFAVKTMQRKDIKKAVFESVLSHFSKKSPLL